MQAFRVGANLLEVLGHAANFYLYCLCSAEYRAVFARLTRLICSLAACRRFTQSPFSARSPTTPHLTPAIPAIRNLADIRFA